MKYKNFNEGVNMAKKTIDVVDVLEELDKLTALLVSAGVEQDTADDAVLGAKATADEKGTTVIRELREYAKTGETNPASKPGQINMGMKSINDDKLRNLTLLY